MPARRRILCSGLPPTMGLRTPKTRGAPKDGTIGITMPTRSEIRTRIRRTVLEALSPGLDEAAWTDEQGLDAFMGMDSIAALECVIALEKEFGIELDPDNLEMKMLTDLERLTDLVAVKANRASPE